MVSFEATVYRVLIASPGDLGEERDTIEKVVHAWNAHAEVDRTVLLPVRWERHAIPEYGARPQEFINRSIVADCDILIGAFWTRLGTATGGFESGTLEEIEQFHRAGKPVLLYFSAKPINPNQVDWDQLRRVREFRERLAQFALIAEFDSSADLHIKLTDHLRERVRRLMGARAAPPVPSAEPWMRPEPAPSPRPGPTLPRDQEQPDSLGTAESPYAEPGAADSLYLDYWTEFGKALATVGSRLRRPTARAVNWVRISLSRSEMRMNAFASTKHQFLGVELVLGRPACDPLFELLAAQRAEIEDELGERLEWDERGRSYRIVLSEHGFNPADRADWPRQHIWLINKLEHYRSVFMKRIDKWSPGPGGYGA